MGVEEKAVRDTREHTVEPERYRLTSRTHPSNARDPITPAAGKLAVSRAAQLWKALYEIVCTAGKYTLYSAIHL